MKPQHVLLLLLAIAAEVTATTALKFSEGFTKWAPMLVVAVGYSLSFYLLSLLLKYGVPIGIVYAIWSGLGTVGAVAAGVILWQERLNFWAIMGIVFVIGGVVMINLTTNPSH
ncbi:MAG: QacE family quaternary ammonium compound efflux SMR transporter [Chloroflexi bacterium]|nr:QacE family quaternary ammonium compound efflux SMR transporter [Chloroflexota bacterium]